MIEPVEKIILETRLRVWVACSVGGCGILAHAMVGRHDGDHMESRGTALAFAHSVVYKIGLSSSHEDLSTPQILVDTADEVIDDPEHIYLLCTTWRCLPEGVEICSVGANSVLVFEGDVIREAIIPHSINALLQSQGQSPVGNFQGQIATHALGGKKGCKVDDVRVANIPLLPTTTLAIIEDRRLADDIIQHAVPRNDLPSFIEGWDPPGKRIRTSVLISL